MKRLPFLLSLLLFPVFSQAQADTLLRYFDHRYRDVDPDKAVDTAIAIRAKIDEQGYLEQDFYVKTGRIMRRTYYADAGFTVPVGPYEVFHHNGQRRTKGHYMQGRPAGIWRSWSDNGRLTDSVMFNEQGNMIGTRIRWWSDGTVQDSTFYEPDGSGRGIRTERYPNGMIRGSGPMINGNQHGRWTYYQRSGKIASEEMYAMDSLMSIRCFDEKGNVYSEDCVMESEAQYPGGLSAWQRYIASKIYASSEELLAKAQPGTVVVQFIIDTTGKVTEVKLLNETGTFLDDFARRTVLRSPKWIPAKQHNIPVKAYRRQPIIYKLEED